LVAGNLSLAEAALAAESNKLESLQILSPCHVSWQGMSGNDQVRFCEQCQLDVYDLSALTRRDATQLVEEMQGSICVRFSRRRDGTVVTRDSKLRPQGFFGSIAASLAMLCAFLPLTGCIVRSQGSVNFDHLEPKPKLESTDDVSENAEPESAD
jgi:hypothetical protein